MASHNVFECMRIACEVGAKLKELCPCIASTLQQAAPTVTRENMAEWVDGYDSTSRSEIYIATVYLAATFQAPEAEVELIWEVGVDEAVDRVNEYCRMKGYDPERFLPEEQWNPFPRTMLFSLPKDPCMGKGLTLQGVGREKITGVRLGLEGLYVTLDSAEHSKVEIRKYVA